MKKIVSTLSVFALLATMALGINSCGQQNPPEQKTEEQPQTEQPQTGQSTIVGDWKLLYAEFEGEVEPGYDVSITFLENGTYIWYEEGYGNKGTYTISGKNLIIENGDAITKWTIKELTKDMLVISNEGVVYNFKRVE